MPFPAPSDAERYLIGCLIRDAAKPPDGIIPSDFVDPRHQELWAAILSLKDREIAADEITVSEQLRQVNASTQAFYVSELTTAVGFSTLNPAWADEIKRLASLRHIEQVVSKVQKLAGEPGADPEALIAYAEGSFKPAKGRTAKEDGPEPMPLEALRSFDRHADPNSVIGNRWLTKSSSFVLVSQSGVGKSSFTLQFLISLCLGPTRPFFGLKAARPLRVVLVQAENCLGDVAEPFCDICDSLMLHEPEMRLLDENLHIYRDMTSVGPAFAPMMESLIRKHDADIFVCDPLLSFAGIELADQSQVTQMLRHEINPVLMRTGAILFAIHHTTKPRAAKDKEGQTVSDLAYSGAGASEIVNWAREVGVLQRMTGEQPIFKFSLTKRRGRAGLKDHAGDFKGDIFLRHSKDPGIIKWEYATPDDLGQPEETPPKGRQKADRDPF